MCGPLSSAAREWMRKVEWISPIPAHKKHEGPRSGQAGHTTHKAPAHSMPPVFMEQPSTQEYRGGGTLRWEYFVLGYFAFQIRAKFCSFGCHTLLCFCQSAIDYPKE